MPYVVHDLQIDPSGQLPPAVVIKLDVGSGITDRESAIAAARQQLSSAGIRAGDVTRVAHTPSGGWSVSLRLMPAR